MTILFKAICRYNVSPIILPIVFFTKIEKKNTLNCLWNHKRVQITKTILRQNKNAEAISLLDFKIYSKSFVIKQYGTNIKKKNRKTNKTEYESQK
jgi:hypothetical protein